MRGHARFDIGPHYLVGDDAAFGIMGAIWRTSGFVAARMHALAPEPRFDRSASKNASAPGTAAPATLRVAEAWPAPEVGLG